MRTTMLQLLLLFAAALVLAQGQACEAAPIGTAFIYQGHLYDANHVADSLYDFHFSLYDDPSAGTQQGSTVYIDNNDVIDGYFTVELDFGSVFNGDARWLEIGVRPGELEDPNVYTILSPRQEVTPTPYATYADGSNWNNLIDVPTDIADGDDVGITSETDPTVPASVKDGISWSEVSSRPAGLDDGDDVGITTESDPTVPANLKDGVSWTEVANIPAGFADNVDNTGITSESDPTVPANLKDGVSWTEVANIPAGFADNVDNTGITSESDTLDSVCSRGSSTSRSITASTVYANNKFYVNDAGNDNAVVVENTSSSYPTIWARSNGSASAGYFIGDVSIAGNYMLYVHDAGDNPAVQVYNNSPYDPGCYATIIAENESGNGYAGYFYGDLGCSGYKSATVETQSYGNRNLYADESAEVYFFDRGRGRLTNGTCVINLDSMFLETVTINDSYPMLVQITLTADCKGVFVSEKTDSSFTVRELEGGTSNATFDWEVAAKRKGYEDTRMEKITFVEDSSVETAGAGTKSGEEGIAHPTRGVRIIKGE